jgi:tetratricopeptide (TPR) repeat protein
VDTFSLIVMILLLIAAQSKWLWPPVWGGGQKEDEQVPESAPESHVESAQDPLTQLARSLARDDGADTGSAAAICFYRAFALEWMGRLEQALEAYEECQHVPTSDTAARYAALAAFRQGLLLSRQGRWAEAEPCLQSSIGLARAVPLPNLQLSAVTVLMRMNRAAGRPGRALHYTGQMLELAQSLGDEPTQARAFDAAGDLQRGIAQTQNALQSYEQSLDLHRKLSNAEGTLVTQLDIGSLYQACGEWDTAAAWYRACLRDAEESESIADQAAILYELACLHIHKGQASIAAHLLLRDMALYRKMRHRKGADRAGRTLMGLGVWMHHRLTANRLTFRDIERGSATKDEDEDEEDEE